MFLCGSNPFSENEFKKGECLADANPLLPGSFTLVHLPDTQDYAQYYPAINNSQTTWIRDHISAHNIKYVLHTGDLTNNNTITEMNNALPAMNILNGYIPYAISTGNHDYGSNGSNRNALFNNSIQASPPYFGLGTFYALQPSIGGFFEANKTDNSYHFFSAGGRDWLVLALEFGPRNEVVEWADQILDNYPNHTVILMTHAYIYSDETRYDRSNRPDQDWSPYSYGMASLSGGVNDGHDLWRKIVAKHANIKLVLCGHVGHDGNGRLISVGEHGQVIPQIMVDFQQAVEGSVNGGNGYLRLLEVFADGKTIKFSTYSPYIDNYKTDRANQFVIGLMDEPIKKIHSQEVLADQPFLYYRLEGKIDSHIKNLGWLGTVLDGSYTGTGPTPADYDGSSQIETEQALPSMSQWSVAAWVMTNSDASQTIFSNDRDGWNDDVLFGLTPETNAVSTANRWAVIHQDAQTQLRTIAENTVNTIPDHWYHLVAASDGDTLRLYVDGELAAETARAGNDLDFAEVVSRIGRSFVSDNNGWPFQGRIAELSVYDRALSISEITGQRIAAVNRVVAGKIRVTGGIYENPTGVFIEEQAFPGVSVLEYNGGDYKMAAGGIGLNFREGVLLTSVNEHEREGIHITAEVGRANFGDGIMTLCTAEAGYTGTSPLDVNANCTVAWFPFAAGWRGGHVDANGTLATGHDVTQDMISKIGSENGRYQLNLGVDSREDGMLFAMCGNNGDNIIPAGILADGSGWDVRIQDNAADFVDNGEDYRFSFVYVPYHALWLIGGCYDGLSTTPLRAIGDAVMTRLGVGQYQLTIPGQTPETGMLILTVCYERTEAGRTAPDDTMLSYERDGLGNFVIQSRDLPGLNLKDTQFVWAFISYYNPPLAIIRGDLDENGALDILDVGILAQQWLTEMPASADLFPPGGDGEVNSNDFAILADEFAE